jgi:predicted TIM-barrel fold metal-dependent hydrolase
MSMEDERVQHPLMRVPDVDVTLLPRLLKELPHLKVMLLNWFRGVKGDLLARLAATGQVWFDLAMVEGVGGVANLLKNVPAEQLVFGSHAPFFYLESALLKLKESPLSPEQARLIQWGSSARLMK